MRFLQPWHSLWRASHYWHRHPSNCNSGIIISHELKKWHWTVLIVISIFPVPVLSLAPFAALLPRCRLLSPLSAVFYLSLSVFIRVRFPNDLPFPSLATDLAREGWRLEISLEWMSCVVDAIGHCGSQGKIHGRFVQISCTSTIELDLYGRFL